MRDGLKCSLIEMSVTSPRFQLPALAVEKQVTSKFPRAKLEIYKIKLLTAIESLSF